MADQRPIDDALLSKFLAGETDPDESARVRQWLASQPSPDDSARFKRIRESAADDSGTSATTSTVDTDAARRSIKKKRRTTDRQPVPQSEPVRKLISVQRTERQLDWYSPVYQVAAVLVLVAGMGWLTYRLRFFGRDHPAAQLVTLTTNRHQLRKTLPDGTRILLNRHSTLRYPTSFAGDRRDVTLTGEAFFDVMPDATRPFRIQARKTVVQVLGTSVGVRAYDANVSVAVETGNVRFSDGRHAAWLTKNQQAIFDASADTIRRSMRLSPNVFAYRTGQLVFDREVLRNAVLAINQVYDTDIQLANAQLGNCHLTARFDKTSLENVLTLTAKTLDLRVRHEGKQVVLDGAGCP